MIPRLAHLLIVFLTGFATATGAALALGAGLPTAGEVAVEAQRGGEWDLYLVDVRSKLAAPLTRTPGHEQEMAWSPDGAALAYMLGSSEDSAIWLVRPRCPSLWEACTPPQIFLPAPGYDGQPAWSPDGARLAFVSGRSGELMIYLADVATGSLNPLLRDGAPHVAPHWSPDGTRLLYNSEQRGYRRLYALNLTDGTAIPVGASFATGPAWSPDGTRIAFTNGGDIIVVPSDCGLREYGCLRERQNVSQSGHPDSTARWSPDGTRLMYQTLRGGTPRLMWVPSTCLDSPVGCQGRAQWITQNLDFQLLAEWSGDGQQVTLLSRDSGYVELYRVEVGTGAVEQLTRMRGLLFAPVWRPGADPAPFPPG